MVPGRGLIRQGRPALDIEEGELRMPLYDYQMGAKLESLNFPFYALIQAAMRQADTENLEKLRAAWPEVYDELKYYYNLPGALDG